MAAETKIAIGGKVDGFCGLWITMVARMMLSTISYMLQGFSGSRD